MESASNAPVWHLPRLDICLINLGRLSKLPDTSYNKIDLIHLHNNYCFHGLDLFLFLRHNGNPCVTEIKRVIGVALQLQGCQVFNRSSRFTDISSKCKRKYSYKGRCLIKSIFATLFCSPALSDRALSHFIVKPTVKDTMAPAAEPSFLVLFAGHSSFDRRNPEF
jgi:hypothetical protein